jgi:DNA-binding NarL/FixJ family response regulator
VEKRTAAILGRVPLWVGALRELAESSGLDVVGSACDRAAGLRLLDERPDVFIVEIDGDDGSVDLELIRAARRAGESMRVVALSRADDRSIILTALAAGADLYALTSTDPRDLVVGILQMFDRSVFLAGDWLLPGNGHPRESQSAAPKLTARELEILHLLAEGYTNRALATRLSVTERTIKFHVSNILRKLEVSNRTEASSWAAVRGFLPLVVASDPVDVTAA